jgi:hypothetical protein
VRKRWLGKYALTVAVCNLTIWLTLAVGARWLEIRGRSMAATAPPFAGGFAASRHGPEVVRTGPPFIGDLDEGTVELIEVAPHPSNGAAAWRADGSPATEPLPTEGGSSSAAGKVMREIVIRVRSQTRPSTPVLRFAMGAGFFTMGSSTYPEGPASLLHVQAIACPPDAATLNVTVAVAEGAWQTVHVLRKPTRESAMAGAQSSDSDGLWEAHLEFVEIKGEVALAFHYSSKPLYETRMAVVKKDGTVSTLSGNGTNGAGGMLNSVASLSGEEYAGITEFQLQKRPYQFVGFRNVSLKLGYRTPAEVASEARRAGEAKPAIRSAGDRERSQLEARLLHALEAYLVRKDTKEQPGEEIEYHGLIVDLAPSLQGAEITIDQPKPRSTSPHRAEWSRVRVARLVASRDGNGEWTITGKSEELGLLQFKVQTPNVSDSAGTQTEPQTPGHPTPELTLPAPAANQ